jgi:hypothetical protein
MISLLATKEEKLIIEKSFDSMSELTNVFTKIVSQLKLDLSEFVKAPSEKMQQAQTIALNTPSAVSVIGNKYVLDTNLNSNVEFVSQWIKSNYKETNVFLLGHGFGIALARIAKCDYVDLFTVSPSANTDEKKLARQNASLLDWASSVEQMNLATHSCFNSLLAMRAERVKSKAISELSAKVKTNKLMALLAA